MKKTILTLIGAVLLSGAASAQKKNKNVVKSDRETWVEVAYRMAEPVLRPMSEGKLHDEMQLELSPTWDGRNKGVAYMECFGRLMAGVAPWLSLPDDDSEEGKMRKTLRGYALKSYANAVNPESNDYLLWRKEGQTLVDAAYIAESFLRAYDALWMPLDSTTKARYIDEFTRLRRVDPPYTNWLMFSAMIETFLSKANHSDDRYRITSAFRKMEEWYVGDGIYSDGEDFAYDYYNSYVIHPMYFETLEIMTNSGKRDIWNIKKGSFKLEKDRIGRYATILERMISPEGTFPVVGRSITYRTGVFQPLALMSWREMLPDGLSKGQVRSGLTAVIKRMFGDNRNFNDGGYLTLGFNGRQPNISDWYTNNGSLYMASLIMLPLGLPADNEFWTSPAEKWTSKKAWEGDAFPNDHRLNYKR